WPTPEWDNRNGPSSLGPRAIAKRLLLRGRRGFFEDGLFAGGGSGNRHGGFCWFVGGRGGDGGAAAFGVSFFEVALGGRLRTAGIVVGLFGFAVFVDSALALAQQIKNLAEIDVAPDFRPFFRGLRNGLQRFFE